MADIDTKVLYLETPSVSAPPAAYTIGVRMKNVGIHDRATAGYVSVFRKSTGLLEHTYAMASAVIEPDEEKQAFSTETWDLREEDPGTEFILSGAITSDGDMIPSNDILNPTTVTVIDEPPPPPPPVASHHAQHEDGGADELSVEGLHGELADGQPYEDHAAKHQDGGDDEISLASLSGQTADPQTPSNHGNERHIEDFTTEAEALALASALVTQHDSLLIDVHEDSTSLEHTAAKFAANGYAGLDGDGQVSAAQLGDTGVVWVGGTNLLGSGRWAQPVSGCAFRNRQGFGAGSGEVQLGWAEFPDGWIGSGLRQVCLDAEIFGRVDTLVPGDTVTFRIYAWPTAGGALPALHTVVWTAAPTDNDVNFHATLRAAFDPTANNLVGSGCILGLDTGAGPNAGSHAMPSPTVGVYWDPQTRVMAYATIQVIGATIQAYNFSGNIRSSVQLEYG